jgi:hypothetical protein
MPNTECLRAYRLAPYSNTTEIGGNNFANCQIGKLVGDIDRKPNRASNRYTSRGCTIHICVMGYRHSADMIANSFAQTLVAQMAHTHDGPPHRSVCRFGHGVSVRTSVRIRFGIGRLSGSISNRLTGRMELIGPMSNRWTDRVGDVAHPSIEDKCHEHEHAQRLQQVFSGKVWYVRMLRLRTTIIVWASKCCVRPGSEYLFIQDLHFIVPESVSPLANSCSDIICTLNSSIKIYLDNLLPRGPRSFSLWIEFQPEKRPRDVGPPHPGPRPGPFSGHAVSGPRSFPGPSPSPTRGPCSTSLSARGVFLISFSVVNQ